MATFNNDQQQDWSEISTSAVIKLRDGVHCPRCGEFDEGEPIKRYGFRGQVGDSDWWEVHKCPDCGQVYEYKNGDC